MKKLFKKIIDAIFGKRCECLQVKEHTPVKCVDCGKVFQCPKIGFSQLTNLSKKEALKESVRL